MGALDAWQRAAEQQLNTLPALTDNVNHRVRRDELREKLHLSHRKGIIGLGEFTELRDQLRKARELATDADREALELSARRGKAVNRATHLPRIGRISEYEAQASEFRTREAEHAIQNKLEASAYGRYSMLASSWSQQWAMVVKGGLTAGEMLGGDITHVDRNDVRELEEATYDPTAHASQQAADSMDGFQPRFTQTHHLARSPGALGRTVLQGAAMSAPAFALGAATIYGLPAIVPAAAAYASLAGAGVGLTVGGFTEFVMALPEALEHEGIDWSDKQKTTDALNDSEIRSRVMLTAFKKAAPVAAMDAAGIGFMKPVARLTGRIPQRRVRWGTNFASQTTVQGITEGSGEFLGQYWAFDRVNFDEAAIEAIAGAGMGAPATLLTEGFGEAVPRVRRAVRKRAEAKVRAATEINDIAERLRGADDIPGLVDSIVEKAEGMPGENLRVKAEALKPIIERMVGEEGLPANILVAASEVVRQANAGDGALLGAISVSREELNRLAELGESVRIPITALAGNRALGEAIKAAGQDTKLAHEDLTKREKDAEVDLARVKRDSVSPESISDEEIQQREDDVTEFTAELESIGYLPDDAKPVAQVMVDFWYGIQKARADGERTPLKDALKFLGPRNDFQADVSGAEGRVEANIDVKLQTIYAMLGVVARTAQLKKLPNDPESVKALEHAQRMTDKLPDDIHSDITDAAGGGLLEEYLTRVDNPAVPKMIDGNVIAAAIYRGRFLARAQNTTPEQAAAILDVMPESVGDLDVWHKALLADESVLQKVMEIIGAEKEVTKKGRDFPPREYLGVAYGLGGEDTVTGERFYAYPIPLHILPGSSPTTVIHEFAHFMDYVLSELGTRGLLSPDMQKGLDSVRKEMTRVSRGYDDERESFAKQFEDYVFNGKAADKHMRNLFAMLTRMLARLVSIIIVPKMTASSEAIHFWDSLLAADAVARDRYYNNPPPIESAEEAKSMGLSEEQAQKVAADNAVRLNTELDKALHPKPAEDPQSAVLDPQVRDAIEKSILAENAARIGQAAVLVNPSEPKAWERLGTIRDAITHGDWVIVSHNDADPNALDHLTVEFGGKNIVEIDQYLHDHDEAPRRLFIITGQTSQDFARLAAQQDADRKAVDAEAGTEGPHDASLADYSVIGLENLEEGLPTATFGQHTDRTTAHYVTKDGFAFNFGGETALAKEPVTIEDQEVREDDADAPEIKVDLNFQNFQLMSDAQAKRMAEAKHKLLVAEARGIVMRTNVDAIAWRYEDEDGITGYDARGHRERYYAAAAKRHHKLANLAKARGRMVSDSDHVAKMIREAKDVQAAIGRRGSTRKKIMVDVWRDGKKIGTRAIPRPLMGHTVLDARTEGRAAESSPVLSDEEIVDNSSWAELNDRALRFEILAEEYRKAREHLTNKVFPQLDRFNRAGLSKYNEDGSKKNTSSLDRRYADLAYALLVWHGYLPDPQPAHADPVTDMPYETSAQPDREAVYWARQGIEAVVTENRRRKKDGERLIYLTEESWGLDVNDRLQFWVDDFARSREERAAEHPDAAPYGEPLTDKEFPTSPLLDPQSKVAELLAENVPLQTALLPTRRLARKSKGASPETARYKRNHFGGNYREITNLATFFEQLSWLHDTSNTYEATGKKRPQWEEERKELIDQIQQRARDVPQDTWKAWEFIRGGIHWLDAWMKIPEFIFTAMDGGKIAGPVWQAIFKPLSDAQDEHNVMLADYSKRLEPVFKRFQKTKLWKSFTEKHYLVDRAVGDTAIGLNKTEGKPENGRVKVWLPYRELTVAEKVSNIHKTRFYTRKREISGRMTDIEEVFMMALNSGTQYGREVILNGSRKKEGMTKQYLNEVLELLTEEDWEAVREVWDMMEVLDKEYDKVHKKVTGIEPARHDRLILSYNKVVGTGENTKVVAVHFEGKPFPVITHAEAVNPDTANRFERLRGFFTQYTPTKDHAGNPEKINLSIDLGMVRAFQAKIHAVTHLEAKLKVGRLFDSKLGIRQQIIDRYSEHHMKMLDDWLIKVTEIPRQIDDPLTKTVRAARAAASTAIMAANVRSAVQQFLGLATAWALTDANTIGVGLNVFFGQGRRLNRPVKMVREKSKYMRFRTTTAHRDLQDFFKKIKGVRGRQWQRWMWLAWSLTREFDAIASSIVWMGVYTKETSRGKSEQEAIDAADSIVRMSQGSARATDLAAMSSGPELVKALTMFIGPLNAVHNVQMNELDAVRGRKRTWKERYRIGRMIVLLYFAAAIVTDLVSDDPDEDQSEESHFLSALIQAYADQYPGVRDIVSGLIHGQSGVNPAPFDFVETGARNVRRIASGVSGEFTGEDELQWLHALDLFETISLFTGGPAIATKRARTAVEGYQEGDYTGPEAALRGVGLRGASRLPERYEEYFE